MPSIAGRTLGCARKAMAAFPNSPAPEGGSNTASAAGGSVLHLHFGNGSVAVETDAATVKKVARYAARARMVSGGKRNSWEGG